MSHHVQRDDVAFSAGQDIPEGHPASPAFSLQPGVVEFGLGNNFRDVLDTGAIVPDDTHPLRQHGKIVWPAESSADARSSEMTISLT